ncbi:MAG: hypothetical protein E7027_04160 [Elusimicrobium sp.]|uniref:ApeI dehydratase-like domain-containing protein n=1 Tax=Candidatus Avelusimicrobium gallicola TaxID=2562704 RepID=A0A928DPR7_9BACT|nr:hypothetical protein [Elusimicrobium sp.]
MSLEENFSACFVRREENSFLYHIPADFPAFNGHFEGNPLLPAVCQMGLCADALSRQEGKPVEVAEVVRSKFMRPIGPGSRVRVSFTPRPEGKFLAELSSLSTEEKFSQIILRVKELI